MSVMGFHLKEDYLSHGHLYVERFRAKSHNFFYLCNFGEKKQQKEKYRIHWTTEIM